MRLHKGIASLVLLAAVVLSCVGASAAGAAPAWRFNGTELTGTESILGVAHNDSWTVPGATTTCGYTLLFMTISNSAGTGKGEVTEFPSYACHATASCKVQVFEAEKLPWPVHVATVATKDYVVIEKMTIGIVYEGASCALAGTRIKLSGSAGGVYENTTSTLTFDKASFEATSTSLKVGSVSIEWDALFPLEALGSHSGEALEL